MKFSPANRGREQVRTLLVRSIVVIYRITEKMFSSLKRSVVMVTAEDDRYATGMAILN
jgi:hypothetical protein